MANEPLKMASAMNAANATANAGVDAADGALLDLLLLQPSSSTPPSFLAEAAALVSLPSVSLDPARVLGAMPDATPLSVAGPILARLLAARTHRRRTAALERGLARGDHAAAAAARADALSRAVLVPVGGRACQRCQGRIGTGKVFAAGEGGLACGACAGVGKGGV